VPEGDPKGRRGGNLCRAHGENTRGVGVNMVWYGMKWYPVVAVMMLRSWKEMLLVSGENWSGYKL